MRDVLDGLRGDRPVVIGGDWNTTTYNSSQGFHAIMGLLAACFHGRRQRDRQPLSASYHRFESALFALLESRGFDYRTCNRLGEHTASFDFDDVKMHKDLREWLPAWCFPFIQWALRNHDGKCPVQDRLVCDPQGASGQSGRAA